MKSRSAVLFGAMLLAACLTGCGGGGGGSSDGTPTPPQDTTKPAIISRTPAQSVGVGTTSAITVVFNEEIKLVPQSFTLLENGTNPIQGDISSVGTTAKFKPTSALAVNTSYTATVTTGVTDLAGNQLAASYSWQFKTGEAQDSGAPMVLSTFPASDSTGAALNSAILVTFNEDMDPASINAQTITLLKDGTIAVAGTVTYIGTTALFKPTSALVANAAYTASVTTGVKDLAGIPLDASYSWKFTTGGASDSTAPRVLTTNPASNATGVAVTSAVTVTFTEPVIPFYYGLVEGNPVAVTFNNTYTTVTLKPAEPMNAGATYAIGIMVQDMAGNPMTGAYLWQFSTSP